MGYSSPVIMANYFNEHGSGLNFLASRHESKIKLLGHFRNAEVPTNDNSDRCMFGVFTLNIKYRRYVLRNIFLLQAKQQWSYLTNICEFF